MLAVSLATSAVALAADRIDYPDGYLLELARYVVLNPVRAGMVSKPEEWR